MNQQMDEQMDQQMDDFFNFDPAHDFTAYPDAPEDGIFAGNPASTQQNHEAITFPGSAAALNTSFAAPVVGVYHSPRSISASVSHSPPTLREHDGVFDTNIFQNPLGPVDPVLLKKIDTGKQTSEPSPLTPSSLGARGSDASSTSVHTLQHNSRSRSRSSSRTKEKGMRRSSKASTASAADPLNREQLLERNRVAASKCRAKRKVEEEELARRAEVLETENQRLKAEYNSLVAERNNKKSEVLDAAYCNRNHPEIQQWVNTRAMAIAHGIEPPVSQPFETGALARNIASPKMESHSNSRSVTPVDRRDGSLSTYVMPNGTAPPSATSAVFGTSIGGASFAAPRTGRQSSSDEGSPPYNAIPATHKKTDFAEDFDGNFPVKSGSSNYGSAGPSPVMGTGSESGIARGVKNLKQGKWKEARSLGP